ncbi:AraC family transcriptional regulator [Spirillospora sp. NPDC029432]|uniref:AraC family transcriptional regulator n=1 Tax=Spirillospora sp. NPDC029432 TaxID=3154599 RepID=UPI003455BA6A
MDVLSDVISAARLGRPHSSRVTRTAPFGESFPEARAAGFHIVLQGTCTFVGPAGEPVTLGQGDLVFLPRGAAHGLADSPSTPLRRAPAAPGEDGDVVLLCRAYLLDAAGHPMLDALPDVIRLPARVGRYPELRAAVDLLGAELAQAARPGADAALPTLLDLLLLYILRAWFAENRDTEEDGWGAALHDPAVSAALRAVHGDPAHPWTVEELAAQAGLSRAAFARRFTRLVGRPPLTYLTWWRMTTAARLLRSSDASVQSVARRTGYTSQYAFSHAFKRHYGAPPGVYRQRPEQPLTPAPRAPAP